MRQSCTYIECVRSIYIFAQIAQKHGRNWIKCREECRAIENDVPPVIWFRLFRSLTFQPFIIGE